MKIQFTIRNFLFLLFYFLVFKTECQVSQSKMDLFIEGLMKKMTLEEKIGQLNLPSIGFDITGPLLSKDVESKIQKGLVGGVFNTYTVNAVKKLQDFAITKTRLKIPLLFGFDVIHGHRTIFPIPLGLSCSWNLSLIEKTANAAALEASAEGLCWTFSPMVDISRDPRWGRVSEGAGEDPFLGSMVANAYVQGYQGSQLDSNSTIMACVKHFALYGAAESGRDYNTVDMSLVKMYNDYLPPYKAAIEAGVGTVMTAFNEINGIPASGNKWLLMDLLRNQWKFNGFVVTDYTAINEMVAHGYGNEKTVCTKALKAGVEMDMVGELYLKHLAQLVKEKKIKHSEINRACKLILEAKYKLGLFSDPYKFIRSEKEKTEIRTADKLALSLEAAIESMVLLKNKNQILPLKKDQKIAFIGPFVKDKRNLIGNWSGAGDFKLAVSVWEALEQNIGLQNIVYAKGCNVLEDEKLIKKLNEHDGQIILEKHSPEALILEAIETSKSADVIVAMLGETFGMSGEAASRSDIRLPENQINLLKALKKTGKPIVLLLMNGRPLCLEWEDEHMEGILETWFAGSQAGEAIYKVLYGEAIPSGKITMSFPRNIGQIPIYYNVKNTGRPLDLNQKYTSKYLDVENDALYPFGYGLSYTEFKYKNLQIDKKQLHLKDSLIVSIEVENTGPFDATETVQLYIQDKIGSITRPVKELKGFKKIYLKKGETKQVKFTIREPMLRFYNESLKFKSESGEFQIFIGKNSRDLENTYFHLILP
ncbi:MAG: beta-glucosidase BglX [Saprospiraceae bacterium]|nr:beta-glucosidase BglX [Saprospiraceae bacterium]